MFRLGTSFPYGKMSPGPSFLSSGLTVPLASAAAAVLASHFLDVSLTFRVSAPALLAAVLLSVPTIYACRILLRDRDVRHRAQNQGAVLPPCWDGHLLGNVDLLASFLERFRSGYLGEGPWDRLEELRNLCSISILWDVTYFTIDSDVIKTILTTDFASFEKGTTFRKALHSVLGTGVFNSDGDMWRFHRTMTRPYFSRERISHFELFDRHAGLAIKKMKERLRGGHAVDFQDVVSRFTLDSATQFLFGKCVQSLEDPLPYAYNDPCAPQLTKAQTVAEQFTEALAEAQRVIATRPRAARVWPLLELLGDRSAGPMRVVDAFLQPIIDEAVAKNRAARAQVKNGAVGSEEAEDHRTLLDHLVKITDDPVVLHDETVNILIAGKDTTAATLTFAIYMMCLNPHVFEQLRAEVFGTVGSQRSPTFDDIRNMKYLRAVINETLRLYAPVPYNFRVANRDTTLPNSDPSGPNVFIPKGTGIAFSVLMMHRCKDYWGPDALCFDPDRWLDERLSKYFAVNPSIFAPFNAGPRICLGQQFAYNEMSFFLIRLAQNFSGMELDLAAQPPDARPPPEWAGAEGRKGLEKVVPKCHLTIYVHGGLWVKMIEADRET